MATHADERRAHRRSALSCPVALTDDAGEPIARSHTINISDGGMLVSLSIEALKQVGKQTRVTLSVPRSVPGQYHLEEFETLAHVVRHQPMVDERYAGAALQFEQPVDLHLDSA